MFPVLMALLALDLVMTTGCLAVMLARRLLGWIGLQILERQRDVVKAAFSVSAWVAANDSEEVA